MATETLPSGIASRSLPQPQTVDGQPIRKRLDRYGGDVLALNYKRQLADEGAYFTIQNPTPGTGVANTNGVVTAFSATSGQFMIFNADATGGKSLYLDYIRLMPTAVQAGTLDLNFVVTLDNISRFPATATHGLAHTPANVNGGSPVASVARVQVFTATAPAVLATGSASSRRVARAKIPTGLNVVGDEYILQFGADDFGASKHGGAAIRATDVARCIGHAGPVIVAPGWSATVMMWNITEAGATSYEYEMGWFER